jgi:magnesium-transporting ATPase (P-type)
MYAFHYYFRIVYFLTLLMTVLVFPLLGFIIFVSFKPLMDYQLFFEAKFFAYFVVLIICLFISRQLYNLRYEEAPQSIIHVLWVLALTMALIFVGISGYTITKDYFIAFQDDTPVQTDSKLTKVTPIEKSIFSPIDNSLYGQIPYNAIWSLGRYSIQMIDSNQQVYQTAYFSSKSDFDKTYKLLQKQIGKNVVITLLPHSKRILSIEDSNGLTPIYKNAFLLYRD